MMTGKTSKGYLIKTLFYYLHNVNYIQVSENFQNVIFSEIEDHYKIFYVNGIMARC